MKSAPVIGPTGPARDSGSGCRARNRSDGSTAMTGRPARPRGRFIFTPDTVVAKTVSYLAVDSDPDSERRLETQLLHLNGDEWKAYNYVWTDDQSDALLQEDLAIDRKLKIKDPDAAGGTRTQTWRHASPK